MTFEVRLRTTGSTKHYWVAPPFDGTPTGGTVYNAALCDALSRTGIVCERLGVDDALRALSAGSADCYWVDTLYLEAMPELARANVAGAPLRLVVHYLPSIVPATEHSARLLRSERDALETASACLVTSRYMAEVLRGHGVPSERTFVVEPGVAIARAPEGRSRRAPEFRAIVVANLAHAKGVRDLLTAMTDLGKSIPREVPFSFSVVGSLEVDPEYARSCRTLADTDANLTGRVDFLGSLPHDGVMAEMSRSDVLISASKMESYGMALAEARAVGVPILALRGGNVENLVDVAAGGVLFDDIDALVADLIALARNPAELRRRTALAQDARRVRTWDEAAEDFVKNFVRADSDLNLKPEACSLKPDRARWTMGHSVGMVLLVAAAWAANAPWLLAAGGAASLLGLVALEHGRWTQLGTFGRANSITLARLVLVVAVASSSAAGPVEALGAAAVLCLDWLDGRVARRRREASEFGARFDMETDALFIAVVGVKLAVAGRLGAWILIPGLLRYVYAIAIGLVETRGEAPRSRFGRYVFAAQGTSLAVALWPVESIFRPLVVVATLLTVYSFARSAYWSLGVARIHPDRRAATG